jgi:hypothetical protein
MPAFSLFFSKKDATCSIMLSSSEDLKTLDYGWCWLSKTKDTAPPLLRLLSHTPTFLALLPKNTTTFL